MKKLLFTMLAAAIGFCGYAQTSPPMAVTNTSSCEVYLTIQVSASSTSPGACSAGTTTMILPPSSGTTLFATYADFVSAGHSVIGATGADVITWQEATFQFNNCACGGGGGVIGNGIFCSGATTWGSPCVNASLNLLFGFIPEYKFTP